MTHGSPASPTLPDGIATIHVVTPCWNAAATIDETIRSILGQQGAFRLRYHIQDGGSDDGTVERIKSFEGALASGAAKIGCLEVVLTWDSAPDGGMYDAIAKGFARLAAPAGDFMTWLNADDLLLPGSLDRVARLATSRPDVAWVGGARHLVDEAGRLIEHDPDTPFPREIIAQGLCDGIHWQFVRQEGLFWRASLYAAAGGLDIGLSRAGDWDLWRRMAAYAPRHALPVALGAFRRRHGQISADLTPYFAEIDAKVPRPVRARLARLLRDKLPTLEAPKLADPLGGVPQVNEPAQAAAETWRLTHFPDTPWPRITIVTPSFNQGIFLDACMRSILDQGYPNLEYIVLDGGSTDNSVTVIRSHAKELTHWRSGPDGGQYRAVEEGLALGTGEIMAWLNADDLYHDFCLFKVAMLFLSHPDVDWLIGRPTVANAEGNICYRQRDLAWSRSKILSAKGALDEEFMGQDAVFWRRSLWARAGARLDHRFGLAADYELWVRFARHAALHTVRDELSSFRYHGDQRSLAAKAGYHREMAAVIEAELSRLRRMPATTPLDQAPPFLSLDYAAVFPPAATGTLSPRHGESPGASVGPAGLEALEAELRLLQRTLANPLSLRVDFQKDDAGLHQLSGGLPASVRYVFFDCFDTLLYRLSDEPTRLFVEVGRRLLRAGLLAAHVSPGEFRVLRQVAETRAREDAWSVRRTRECSIEEIYARLAPVVGDPGRAVEAEIETERDFCYLNPNIASLIATLHRSGKRVAVLSDNYLSSAQLASVLRACGLDLGLFDLILTSRDVGVTKDGGQVVSGGA